ncbi:MAG: AAA family ATPase [Pirellulaceae bacterium]
MFHLQFQRIQFAPDLMPADIAGTRKSWSKRRTAIARCSSSRDRFLPM